MNYQRKNGSDATLQGRRISIRRSPTTSEHPEELLVHEHLQDVLPEEVCMRIKKMVIHIYKIYQNDNKNEGWCKLCCLYIAIEKRE